MLALSLWCLPKWGPRGGLNGWRMEARGGRPDILFPFTSFPERVTSMADLQQERWFVFSSWFCLLTVPSLASPTYGSGSSSFLGVPPQLLLYVLSPLPRTSSVTSQGCLCVFQYSCTNLTRAFCWILSVENDSWCVSLARSLWIDAVLE